MGKRVLAIALLCALILSLSACSGDNATQEGPAVTMLTIATPPDRVDYEEGDLFDPAGIVINATLSNGTVEENVDYHCKQKEALTPLDNVVTFTYGGKSTLQTISVSYKGNNEIYSAANTPALEDSPLAGKTYLFLGSSVTYGYGSDGESMADFLAKRNGCVCIKEAVSGTTLADIEDEKKGDSYVKRLEALIARVDCPETVDAFICQLSTNDMYDASNLGTVTGSEVFDPAAFDKSTTCGAMEYIIALVRETWGCPILFYTNSYLENKTYAAMVTALQEIGEKWGVTVIDLYNDTDFNAVSEEEYQLYMTDNVHPTKAGYRDWWLPKFEEALTVLG